MVTIIKLSFLILLVTTLISIKKGAPYVKTSDKTIEQVLKLLKLKRGDKFVDLGSGDGRVVIEVAKNGIEAHGFEINPVLIIYSKLKVRTNNLIDAEFYWKSFWKTSLSKYNVIYVFGISHIMNDLEKKILKECNKGTTILTQSYKLPHLKPKIITKNKLYLYKI